MAGGEIANLRIDIRKIVGGRSWGAMKRKRWGVAESCLSQL